MISFLKKLFGGTPPEAAVPNRASKPPIPDAVIAEFKDWFLAQRESAIALIPDSSGAIAKFGSRLGGPAWIANGEKWPLDKGGVPLELIAQLDCADCKVLQGYPAKGVIQFFIGRDDLYGADFDDLLSGSAITRFCDTDAEGMLIPPPPLEEIDQIPFSDFSPFIDAQTRANGIALVPQPFEDWIDPSIKDAELRVNQLYKQYDIGELEQFLETDEMQRPAHHHTGGYPAFTQSDIRYNAAYAAYDHVLLRLTSDDTLMWGDVGEAVFMIRSEDLAKHDFSRVAYSWDCC